MVSGYCDAIDPDTGVSCSLAPGRHARHTGFDDDGGLVLWDRPEHEYRTPSAPPSKMLGILRKTSAPQADDVRVAVAAVLREHGMDEDSAREAAADIVTRVLAVEVGMEAPPALHRDASRAQRHTVDELVQRGMAEPRVSTLRALSQRPMTCDEMEVFLGTSHQSQSALLNWCENEGLAERDTTMTRRTRSGRPANPYVLTLRGAEVLALLG